MADLPTLIHAARDALQAYDDFMAGRKIDQRQHDLQRAVANAACFAAAAYCHGDGEGQSTHALARSFLLGLIDPAHPELDYLRADPSAGRVARDASAALRGIVNKGAGNG